jgi:hypothetical protein
VTPDIFDLVVGWQWFFSGNELPSLLQSGQMIVIQIGQTEADFSGGDAEHTLAECLHGPSPIDREEIAAVTSDQNEPFLRKRISKAPAAIGPVEAIPNAFARGMHIHTQPPRLLLFGAGWREAKGAATLIRDGGQSEPLLHFPAYLFQARFEKGQRLCGEGLLINPGPDDVHMGVPGVCGGVKRNRARLIGQSEHPLDEVRHKFPL